MILTITVLLALYGGVRLVNDLCDALQRAVDRAERRSGGLDL